MKFLIGFILVVGILVFSLCHTIYHSMGDYSRQEQKVLINLQDTGTIVWEERELPFFVSRKRQIQVSYKDKLGVYHVDSFSENKITEIK